MPTIIPDSARWVGNHRSPAELHRLYYYDVWDVMKEGRKPGRIVGTLYHVTPQGLVKVRYDENGREIPYVYTGE